MIYYDPEGGWVLCDCNSENGTRLYVLDYERMNIMDPSKRRSSYPVKIFDNVIFGISLELITFDLTFKN